MPELYNYSPIIERSQLILPNEARVAVWVVLNIEHYELGKPSTSIFPGTANLNPDPLNYGWRDYGVRVGLWRVMETLDKFNLPASVLLNSDVCSHYPKIIEEGNKRQWAWVAHGKNNSTFQTNMSIDEEHAFLKEIVTTIENKTGQRPKGWLGPALTETYNTPEILAGLGLTYLLDWCNDDQPYPLNISQGRMISIPYSIEINDIPLFVGKNLSGDDFTKILIDQFDTLYKESKESARVMAIDLHPFIIGQPFRIKYLEKALEYITSHDKVWLTTSDDLADWYLKKNIPHLTSENGKF